MTINEAAGNDRPGTLTARHTPGVAASALASALDKWRRARNEAAQLFGMARSFQEQLSVARFLGRLYAMRALPFDSFGWDASIRLRGADYTIGLRTSEVYVLQEVFDYGLYDRVANYVPESGWVVFDVGANVGIVSVLEARRHAQVFAFEPNPDCYRRLLKNISKSGLQGRIHAFNLALGERVGMGKLQVTRGGTTGGTVIAPDFAASEPSPSVLVTTLDQMVGATGVQRIDLLKIDVEGAEVAVLRGGARALEITDRLIIEYHSRRLLEQVEALTAAQGFVPEHRIVYFPECPTTSEEEVGIVYLSRPAANSAPARAVAYF